MGRFDRLRILMTTDTVGGVWRYTVTLAQALAERRVEVVVAAMGPAPTPEQQAELAGVAVLEAQPWRLEWMHDCDADLTASADWLFDLERRYEPTLLHVNGFAQATVPLPVPILCVAHSDVVSWYQAVAGHSPGPEWDAYRARVRAGLANANAVVAPSRRVLLDLVRYYGPLNASRVIPHGIPTVKRAPGPKEPFVLAEGRIWDEAKNLAALERIADRLAWPVEIAGADAPLEGAPAGSGRVRMLGELTPAELADRMARAAIFALPACYEPFGLSVLEAAANGCALVLGDIPSLRQPWGSDALYVRDDDELEEALVTLIGDADRLAELGRRAHRRSQHFGADRMAAEYLDLYVRLGDGRLDLIA